MVEHNFYKVCMLTLGIGILAFVIISYSAGYYFSFSYAFKSFGQAIRTAPDFSLSVLDDLKVAFGRLANGNPIGFKYSSSNVLLTLLKVLLNGLIYLISLFSIPVELLVAFCKFFFQCISMFSFCLYALGDSITNSWLPFGSGGFIQPDDWYGLLTNVPFLSI